MKTNEVTIACVLAVDDSPEVHELLEVRLRPEGLHLVTASSYDEGLRLAREILPDLILLDVDMPEHSGLDLCRRLKDDPMTSNIPVIFLTGSADSDSFSTGQASCNGVVARMTAQSFFSSATILPTLQATTVAAFPPPPSSCS